MKTHRPILILTRSIRVDALAANPFASLLRSNKVLGNNAELIKEVGLTFSTLLNPENEIIIEGYYFKLNFDTEKAVVRKIDIDNCDLKSSLENEELVFDFNDDVSWLFQKDTNLKSVQSVCSVASTGWIYNNELDQGHTEYRVRYSKYIVYNILIAEHRRIDGQGIELWIYDTKPEVRYSLQNDADTVTPDSFWCQDGDSVSYIQHTIYEGSFVCLDYYNVTEHFAAQSDEDDYVSFSTSLSCN
ncbi:MAG: hypothetical protein K9H26_02555 [Prolixibacteraceae bacterium]|nr:hypothetical protein [Prolixibacteraceae bacterium]